MKRRNPLLQRHFTKEGMTLPDIPWEQYPRPQLRRADWLCLNGEWEYSSGKDGSKIRVPFCPESLLSGVHPAPAVGEKLVYRRRFSVPEHWRARRVLLHFGAVMRSTTVYINGSYACSHQNGYLPFSEDISDLLRPGENDLTVVVINDLDSRWPWGKQSKNRGGMWYTPCSGIWQSVWLEPVPERYIRSLRIKSGADWVQVSAEGVSDGVVELAGQEYPLKDGTVRIEINEPHLWSPEDPWLYSFTLKCGEDRVESYLALRTLTTENINGTARLCLNGKPYFFNGLLDQGYWSDGLYTPAAPVCYEKDILAMKSLGFNTLRKHIKIEPEQFYYDCDRLGMIVFQDMVNNGRYCFLRDSALPTLHLQKCCDRYLNLDATARRNFLKSMEDTVNLLGNHPCICLWTVFNEGWGQFRADKAYNRLKELDPDRFIDTTSGWFHQRKSDVDSQHIYFERLHLGKEKLPQLISEFGGYIWKDFAHSFNLDRTYGYRKYSSREDYVRALRELYSSLLPLVEQGLCGAIYTQVSDVEDETNGLLTFDRERLKVTPEELKDLTDALTAYK